MKFRYILFLLGLLTNPQSGYNQIFLEELSFPGILRCRPDSKLEAIDFIEVERKDLIKPPYTQYFIKTQQFVKFKKGKIIDYVNIYDGKRLLDSIGYEYSKEETLDRLTVFSGENLQLQTLIEIEYDSLGLPFRLIRRGIPNIEIQQVVKRTEDYVYIQFWVVGKEKNLYKFKYDPILDCIPYHAEKEIKNVLGQVIMDVIEIPKENGKSQFVLSEYAYDERGNWIHLSTYLLEKNFRKKKRNLLLQIDRKIHYLQ